MLADIKAGKIKRVVVKDITFAQLTVKTVLYVRPILSGALSLKKSCCETCGKPFSM